MSWSSWARSFGSELVQGVREFTDQLGEDTADVTREAQVAVVGANEKLVGLNGRLSQQAASAAVTASTLKEQASGAFVKADAMLEGAFNRAESSVTRGVSAAGSLLRRPTRVPARCSRCTLLDSRSQHPPITQEAACPLSCSSSLPLPPSPLPPSPRKDSAPPPSLPSLPCQVETLRRAADGSETRAPKAISSTGANSGNRLDERMRAMEADRGSFTQPPSDPAAFASWARNAPPYDAAQLGTLLRTRDALRATHAAVVPAALSEGAFWTRYQYNKHMLVVQEQRRLDVLRRVPSKPQAAAPLSSWDSFDDESFLNSPPPVKAATAKPRLPMPLKLPATSTNAAAAAATSGGATATSPAAPASRTSRLPASAGHTLAAVVTGTSGAGTRSRPTPLRPAVSPNGCSAAASAASAHTSTVSSEAPTARRPASCTLAASSAGGVGAGGIGAGGVGAGGGGAGGGGGQAGSKPAPHAAAAPAADAAADGMGVTVETPSRSPVDRSAVGTESGDAGVEMVAGAVRMATAIPVDETHAPSVVRAAPSSAQGVGVAAASLPADAAVGVRDTAIDGVACDGHMAMEDGVDRADRPTSGGGATAPSLAAASLPDDGACGSGGAARANDAGESGAASGAAGVADPAPAAANASVASSYVSDACISASGAMLAAGEAHEHASSGASAGGATAPRRPAVANASTPSRVSPQLQLGAAFPLRRAAPAAAPPPGSSASSVAASEEFSCVGSEVCDEAAEVVTTESVCAESDGHSSCGEEPAPSPLPDAVVMSISDADQPATNPITTPACQSMSPASAVPAEAGSGGDPTNSLTPAGTPISSALPTQDGSLPPPAAATPDDDDWVTELTVLERDASACAQPPRDLCHRSRASQPFHIPFVRHRPIGSEPCCSSDKVQSDAGCVCGDCGGVPPPPCRTGVLPNRSVLFGLWSNSHLVP